MFANNMKKVTDKLTKKFGDTITLVEIIQGDYNPDTGLVDETEIDHIVRGVISSYNTSDILPESVNVDDLMVMVYANDYDLDKSWNVRYNNKVWNIIAVSRLSTQDETIYYKLQIRSK